MKIACLGWGSLVWRPESLLIHRQWFNDGSIIPVEFARQSRDGRLTLVIVENRKPIRTLWALMATADLNEAKQSLQIREGIGQGNIENHIASVSIAEDTTNAVKVAIQQWIKTENLDAAIWTNLPPRFNAEDDKVPTITEVIDYLSNLNINQRQHAETYIRRTPAQVDTDYRKDIEKAFGWTFLP